MVFGGRKGRVEVWITLGGCGRGIREGGVGGGGGVGLVARPWQGSRGLGLVGEGDK